VVYRKGELSKGTIDRQWPHQVAVPADSCTGANWVRCKVGIVRTDALRDMEGETMRGIASGQFAIEPGRARGFPGSPRRIERWHRPGQSSADMHSTHPASRGSGAGAGRAPPNGG
jgi:hypothetical protein